MRRESLCGQKAGIYRSSRPCGPQATRSGQPFDLDIAVINGTAGVVGLEGEGAFADATAGLDAFVLGESLRVFGVVGGDFVVDFDDDVVALDDDFILEPLVVFGGGFENLGDVIDAARFLRIALEGDVLAVDFVANAASLGAVAVRVRTPEELKNALIEARAAKRTTVTAIEVDGSIRVPGYESWWDVPIAEVSEAKSVRDARRTYETQVKRERHYI